jgi:ketosteroid isomerase-like protein
MKRLISIILIMLAISFGVGAQTAPDAAELTRLLNEFLAGASHSDAAIHDRFWADELVYTGSGGRRRSKAQVMQDVRSAPAPKAGDPTTNYSAEDIRIQQYGNTAIVAFRLVGTTVRHGASQVANFFNTGTLIKRDGKWQVVAWQATRIPRDAKDDEKEVAKTELAFHQAMRTSDIESLASLVDETFIWTHRTGELMTRKQLLDQMGSGQLKYAKLETRDVKVNVYGDSAVVRGVSPRQRVNGEPFIAPYTLTFINQGGGWKVVSMHTSRPDPVPAQSNPAQASNSQEAVYRQIVSASGGTGPINHVKDSHDRCANLEVSYLLQRLASFKGISILALNSDDSGDELTKKFLRRFHHALAIPIKKEGQ